MSAFASVRINLLLEEYGWAALEVVVDGREHRIEQVSYLTDVLDDLLLAGIKLALGYGSDVLLDHEGWHSELKFEPEWVKREAVGDGGIHADERWRLTAVEVDAAGRKPLFHCLCESADAIARALLCCGERVWAEHGAEGYVERWISAGFPLRALRALDVALNTPVLQGHPSHD